MNRIKKFFKQTSLKGVGQFFLTLLIPLFYFLNLGVIYFSRENLILPWWFRLGGLVLTYAGFALWILSYLNLGRSFGVLPETRQRVERGVYRYFRHPMYLAIMATFGGLSLAVGSREGLLVTALVTFPLLVVRAWLEEKRLR